MEVNVPIIVAKPKGIPEYVNVANSLSGPNRLLTIPSYAAQTVDCQLESSKIGWRMSYM